MMKPLLLVLFFWLSLNASGQTALWERTYLPPQAQYCHRVNYGMTGESIAFDIDSNIMILGRFHVGGDSCVGQADNGVVQLLKLNPDGDTLWTRIFMEQQIVQNFASELSCFSIRRTLDNNFIIAGNSQDAAMDSVLAVLIKIDADGNVIWKKKYVDRYIHFLQDIYEAANNELLSCGWSADGGGSNQKIYILKTDSAGNELWHNTYGNGYFGEGYSIVFNPTNGIYTVMGRIIPSSPNWGWRYKFIALNINGNDGSEISRHLYGDTIRNSNCYGGILTSDNNYITVGAETRSTGGYNLRVVKSDLSGNVQWTNLYGINDSASFYMYVMDVVQTSDSGYIITGNKAIVHPPLSIDTTAFFLLKIDKNGNQQWEKVWRLGQLSYISCIKEYYDHGYIITGFTQDTAFTMECYVARFDSLATVYNPINVGTVDLYSRAENISLFPNPTANELRIKNVEWKIRIVEIFNLFGEQIVILQPEANSQELLSIDISLLKTGVYFIAFTDDKRNKVTRKFVKL